MSLSIALATAASGISAASRGVQVTSDNIANAQTPGYSVRRLSLAVPDNGAVASGVRVVGLTRQVDPIVLDLLRLSSAPRAAAETLDAFWSAIEGAVGLPDAPGSLTSAVAGFTTALVTAAERPDLDHRLAEVARTANGFVEKLHAIEATIQSQRLQADASISRDLQTLDQGLARLHLFNSQIATHRAGGQPTLDLEDARDVLLGDLSQIVPLKAHARPDGTLMVYSERGLILLDRQPAALGFVPATAIGPRTTFAGGELSGVSVNGRLIASGPDGPLAGGRLSAALAVRDTEAPAIQAQLDMLAISLASRFQAPGVDPTLQPGLPGFFTEAGGVIPTDAGPGIAGRLAVNPLIQSGSGGGARVIRDGLGAVLPGPVGNREQLDRWLAALDRLAVPAPGRAAQSLASEIDRLLSGIGQISEAASERRARTSAVETGLQDRVLAAGVDTDVEMQRLLVLESTYAANARVLRVADDLLRQLLEI